MGTIEKVKQLKRQGYPIGYIKDCLLSTAECTEYEMYITSKRVARKS